MNNRDNTRTQSFTYDTLNRIASAESSGTQWGETFTIDAWSNLTNESGISGKTSHEGLNTSVGINNRLSGFGYDAAGNTISNGSATYVYDAENRLIATAGTSYIYDGEGERVEKCTEGTTPGTCSSGATGTLYWRGTGSETLAETDLAGNEQEEYLFFNGQRIARRDVNSLGATVAVHYYFSDHLGSHGVVENATGTACEQDIDYYPYGGQQNDYCSGSGVSQNYKFTGKERDTETGLDYFGARYFGSNMGRFMTPDSPSYSNRKNPQTWNLYAYSLNNPVTFRDADGHKVECVNNTQQCQQDAANSTANAEAAKRVKTETHGWWIFKTTTIKIEGDINSFRALSPNASKLADLVTSKDTISVSYDQYAKPSFWANGLPLNGGSTSYTPTETYDPQAFIDPTRTPGTVYDPDAVAQGIPQANTAEEFGHEVLGHVWGELFGGHPAMINNHPSRANMRDSIVGENAVRALDPARGQKGLESHHNYNDKETVP